MYFLAFLLGCYGLTNIITGSKLFAPVRNALSLHWKALHSWIVCEICVGFWVGILFGLFGIRLFLFDFWFQDWLLAGFVSSGWCWICRVILAHLGEDKL